MNRQKVVHLITGLGKGGAETMLYQIVKHRSPDTPEPVIVSLGLSSYYEEQLRDLGAGVVELDLRHRPFVTLVKLHRIVRKAETLCCWMYLPCVLGYLVGRKHAKKLIWCIRHSDLNPAHNSRKTLLFSKICAMLSPKVDLITYNGDRARKVHAGAGYRPRKEVVLDNGIDGTEYFRDEKSGELLRKSLGIDADRKVILSVAKNTPIKDLPTFIRMLFLIRKSEPDAVGVMCGSGVDGSDKRLAGYCEECGLTIGKDVYLIGFRDDVRAVMNAADVYVLHSAGEAFPNTLMQAMACETLVAATDVGDVKKILGDEKVIARPGDHRGLAEAVIRLLGLEKEEKEICRKRNRETVTAKYDIRKVVESYEEMFQI